MKDLSAVIMAAGQGTRMRSGLVKVLHPLAGLPMLAYLLELCRRVGVKRTIVVVGHQADRVKEALAEMASGVEFVLQAEQRGTAHAVLQAETPLRGTMGEVLVLSGDVPLLTDGLVERLLETHGRTQAQVTVVTTRLENPTGYGRVLRDATGNFLRVAEEVEATEDERSIQEINVGLYCFSAPALFRALHQVRPSPVKGEFYLPEVLPIIQRERGTVSLFVAPDSREVLGINTREELAEAHAVLRRRIAGHWMAEGVTILDPATVHLSPLVTIGRDTILYPNVHLEGRTSVGEGCLIYPGCRIRDSRLGDGVTVLDGTIILGSDIADACILGPYAHIRPASRLMRKARVGNFVEVKKSVLGEGSKAPHLTYVGDATVGDRVNIGAGTITCNYDGFAKHQTIIEDEAFIGSNTSLVAPIKIGRGAIVAAGSTVTQEVPPDAVAFGRAQQVNKEGRAAEIRKGKGKK
jgi:bifunctional UDP-N-acetylglucosamine pyrophosphorylase/glucosamine-1-phosphate N-acetyltransferase